MTQPTPYVRGYSFTNSFAAQPSQTFPGNSLDAELNNAKVTLDQILVNLRLLQNDDGSVKNASIGPAQLSTALQVGFLPPTIWTQGTSYVASPASTVFNANKYYSCLKSHTSSTSFATDLAAGDWVLIADLSAVTLVSANQISITPAGGITATDVQTAMYGLDTRLSTAMQTGTTATISVGYTVAPNALGVISSATLTPSIASGNYQFYTNNGAHTLAAPAADGAVDLLVTNGASAGTITFSGFTVSASTGDALGTTSGYKFIISIRRINSISTYTIKALQ